MSAGGRMNETSTALRQAPFSTDQVIQYKAGYKYQTDRPHSFALPLSFWIDGNIFSDYVSIRVPGVWPPGFWLIIERGYAWDGASGPAIDTLTFMRGSLVHDALYQLIDLGYLDKHRHRKLADELLREMCIEDGMSKVRAWWVYWALRLNAKRDPERLHRPSAHPVLTAPRRRNDQ